MFFHHFTTKGERLMSDTISVMVIDDDRIIRECVAAFLEDEGFVVTTAESGEEGLKMLRSVSPDVCITDLRLPAMNGREFIVAARHIAPDTGFLIHTGAVFIITDDLVAAGLSQTDILNKPIHDMGQLTARIRANVKSSGV
jgi:DNA-binding response OmpR family regulator